MKGKSREIMKGGNLVWMCVCRAYTTISFLLPTLEEEEENWKAGSLPFTLFASFSPLISKQKGGGVHHLDHAPKETLVVG